jgi:hypothetical protein
MAADIHVGYFHVTGRTALVDIMVTILSHEIVERLLVPEFIFPIILPGLDGVITRAVLPVMEFTADRAASCQKSTKVIIKGRLVTEYPAFLCAHLIQSELGLSQPFIDCVRIHRQSPDLPNKHDTERSFQFGLASAPIAPHAVQTMRGPNVGIGTSSL